MLASDPLGLLHTILINKHQTFLPEKTQGWAVDHLRTFASMHTQAESVALAHICEYTHKNTDQPFRFLYLFFFTDQYAVLVYVPVCTGTL